ncbi:MAG TPA: hypothetical protein VF933_22570 [Streptosporangiaceae bacterium]
MDATTFPPSSITCAKPGCDTVTTLAESGYIDGCGQVCLDCFGRNRAPVAERHRPAVLTGLRALAGSHPTARRARRAAAHWRMGAGGSARLARQCSRGTT